MSFRDIGAILNTAVEEKKKTEGSKEQEQQQLSLSTQAYKLSFPNVRHH
jgi:hypothetical protein